MKIIPKSHGTVVAYLALIVALGGTAQAVTTGVFSLGKSNSETKPTTISNTSSGHALNLAAKAGTPLSLSAPAGTAPLAVSNSVQIPKLNASLLGGLSAAAFQARLNSSCTTGIASVDATGTPTCAATFSSDVVFSTVGPATFVVPAGVKSVVADLYGGGGGGPYYCASAYAGHIWGGGQGGQVEVLLPVTPGDTLTLNVGGGGVHGFQFAAGTPGGASTVAVGGNLVAVANGGLGGLDDATGSTGGDGGT